MVGEHLAAVRCAALRCLGRVLEGVDSLPPSDAKIFNECDAPEQHLHLRCHDMLKILSSLPVACVYHQRCMDIQSHGTANLCYTVALQHA